MLKNLDQRKLQERIHFSHISFCPTCKRSRQGLAIYLTSIESLVTFFLFLNRRLRRHLQEDVVRDLCSSASALQELETEFNKLQEDREILRRIIPSGNSKVSVPMT